MKLRIILLFTLCLASARSNAQILLEAENFSHRGGWVLDHQSFNKVGSACLNAHGLGFPVADAFTDVAVENPGKYHVYVCTYNWTSPWYDGEGAGAFNVIVNGKTLPCKLGASGSKWEWQYAGKVELTGKTRIAIHDLSGFNGRVDAIYFSKKATAPPDDLTSLRQFRMKMHGCEEPEVIENADLVVAGGGVAGCATALTAARYGLKVVLVDNLPKLGGNNWLGVGMCGLMCYNKYPNVGKIVREMSGIKETYYLGHILERVGNGNGAPIINLSLEQLADLRKKLLEEAGVKIFHNTYIYDVETDNGHITSITGHDLLSQKQYVFKGRYFADCTGDGDVGYLAGAEYHIGRESKAFANEPSAPEVEDQKKMGGTLNWFSYETDSPTPFPSPAEIPWAIQCNQEYNIPIKQYEWTWETGFEIDNALEPELVRDNMLRAIFGNWAYQKNNRPEFSNSTLKRVSHIIQKRESRRIMGEFVLNENDIRNQVEYPDASFTTTWTLDLHFAREDNSKRYPGWEWQSYCHNHLSSSWIRPYHVPYRVLYAKGFDNLFIGGRCMSVTHIALGTVRVQATLGMAGEVMGMAAGICKDHDATPAEVYEKYLPELIERMTKGAPSGKDKGKMEWQ